MQYIRFVGWLLLFPSLVFTAACGKSGETASSSSTSIGGGAVSKQIVTGVAAAGSPIKGTVVLKDSKGAQLGPVNTDDDGNFSFDITSLTPPFILKAVGVSGTQNYMLYSVSTESGNAHITPFSNLVLQLAAGADPTTVFGANGSIPNTATIDDTKLKAAVYKVKSLLAPILIEYGITDFDPITGVYSATPDNKLDAMLDIIEIKTENSTLTITNKLDGSVIVSGNLANIEGFTIDKVKCPDKSTLTDIKEITDRLAVLRLIMNKGDTLKTQDLEDLFIADPNYGTSNGHTRAEDMASIITIFGLNGTNKDGKLKSIRNVRLVNDQTANYAGRDVTKAYLINYDFIHEGGNIVHGNNTTWAKDAATGLWKFVGDPANANIGNNNGFVSTSGGITVTPVVILWPSLLGTP
ncbi:MAG: hypothetical protein WC156_10905 [Pedobacter sp.]